MPNRNKWILGLALSLSACATPVTEVSQPEATLPAPVVAIEPAATVAPTVAAQPTEAAAVQPTLSPTELAPEAPIPPTEAPQSLIYKGLFVNMEVPSGGSFSLDPVAGALTFNADFATQSGPDLFVILSGASEVSLDFHSFSDIVVKAPIVYLGPLTATTGLQTYAVPAGTDLSQFRTVVIWCKTYSVAFAAALIE